MYTPPQPVKATKAKRVKNHVFPEKCCKFVTVLPRRRAGLAGEKIQILRGGC
jgi:hypothetical protein